MSSTCNSNATTELEAIFQGDTLTLNLTLTDANGDPIDITRDTMELTIKESPNASADLHSEVDVTMTDPLQGLNTMVVLPAVTETFPVRSNTLSVVWTRTGSTNEVVTILYASLPTRRKL